MYIVSVDLATHIYVFLFYLAVLHVESTSHRILSTVMSGILGLGVLMWTNVLVMCGGQVWHGIFAIVGTFVHFHKAIGWIAARVRFVGVDAQTSENSIHKWCYGRQRSNENCKWRLQQSPITARNERVGYIVICNLHQLSDADKADNTTTKRVLWAGA
jgi:hypothetical protein